jgi:hypothetical protein
MEAIIEQLVELTIDDRANPLETSHVRCIFEIVENNMYIMKEYPPVKSYINYKLTSMSLGGTPEQKKLADKYSVIFRTKKYKPSGLRYVTTVGTVKNA